MSAPFVSALQEAVRADFPVVVVVTHEEARARELIREAFTGTEIRFWTATGGFEGEAGDARDPVQGLRESPPGGAASVRVFFDLHPFFGDARVVRSLRDVCLGERRPGDALLLVMPVADVPRELERDVAILDLPLPDAADLGATLKRVAGQAAWDRPAFVRGALGLSRAEAERAFRLALGATDEGEALRRVIAEKRRALRRSAALELIEPDVELGQVGGLEVLKAWLRARVLAFDEGARAFGLSAPRGMLTCGVQGCGKSLVSKAAARVLGLPLVRLDFAEVFANAAPEHAIREAMRVVEAIAPVVLWVDEIEKGLGGRSPDGRQVRVFGAFLTWLQERRSAVFVAATANDVEQLPPELARRGRFDEVFFVDLPSTKEREEIAALHLVRRGRIPAAYSLADLCKGLEGWSGAELEQLVSGALFRAYAQRRELSDADLRAASRDIVPLATLYEEKVQALRAWGQARARRASADRRTLELFEP